MRNPGQGVFSNLPEIHLPNQVISCVSTSADFSLICETCGDDMRVCMCV